MLKKHPGARACWEAVKPGFPNRDYVDALIENLDDSDGVMIGDAIVPPAVTHVTAE